MDFGYVVIETSGNEKVTNTILCIIIIRIYDMISRSKKELGDGTWIISNN